ncbi:class I SAM-dependent methyltransferase [Bosea caraganae]|uniref:Class I SAM-dependent methyltransferase n=1 Tax=Bosea caraganae TaxID=2763117 RepID=A0A370L1K8_9HYPH|nr:class I SAM-dependent methyltransferase [Bosea caraganae]RDJ21427.1 class I SAM-dependent methyltransferase [Bosea caraganae]RDJ23395.1 class I SAM-dependent methyltransferase [Bosea caraganae]
MTAETITLTEEKETLLITLYGKAGESHLPDSLLKDHFAAEAVSKIDYDFSKLKLDRDLMIGVAMRAHILDGWTREFLKRYPDATVLHLGCGLDSRVFRIDPGPGIRWFDVDYPEVVALRRKLYPQRDNYTLIGSSVTDPAWLEAIPQDKPTMIVAEGLLPYLLPEEVHRLLQRLTAHLPRGELAFDGYSNLGLKFLRNLPSVRATGAKLLWPLDDPRELEQQVPKLRLLNEFLAYDPKGYDPEQVSRMSWLARLTIHVFAMIPPLARMGRLLHYRF